VKWAGILCVFAAFAWAQPSPIIKTETRVVLVDAVVTGKKGELLKDLTAKDFHVWEDKKEQTIQSVSLESASHGPGSPEPVATYLTVMLDYVGMDGGDQGRARQAAASFIDANSGPDHMMAIASFDGGLSIDQGFSANAGRLKDAINSPKTRQAGINTAASGTGALADLGSRNLFRSLEALATNMGAAPGRKIIVLLAGGITLANEQKAELASAIDACNKHNVAVYAIDVRDASELNSNAADNSTPTAGRGGRVASPFGVRGGRGNAAGDADPSAALDPGGVSQQVLFALASGTGGFVIRNPSEMAEGMQKIGQEQEEYYVLSYTPPEAKEGTCHALRVKVDRAGTNVRARSSYCTGKAQELLTGTAAERNLESRAANARSGSAAGSMQLPYFYVGPNTARVNLAMEIAASAVKFDRKKGEAHAEVEILGIAQAPGSDAAGARFSDTLSLDLDEAAVEKAKPLHYEKEFKIAPGKYQMTVAFSSGGESVGKLEMPLNVEPYQPGQLAVSAVAFGREIHKAGESSSSLFDDKTPLIAGGMQLNPSGSSVFTKPEQAFCYFEVYKADAAGVGAIGVRVADAKTGETKWNGGAMKLEPVPAGKTTISLGLALPVEMLPPGAYRLEINAAEGNKSATRSADFEVK
jgi:VWFA-related protein